MSNKYFSIASEIESVMKDIRAAKRNKLSYVFAKNASKDCVDYLKKIGYDITDEGQCHRIEFYD
jgi:hypothetical protein